MKLAEALSLRADAVRRIEQLRTRIVGNARFQEGEEPAEDAAALLDEAGGVLGEYETLDADDIGAVLTPGARVCFTGTAIDDTGSTWARSDLESLAEKCGLEPVQSVTKTKCEALIAAEVATQSKKGKQAAQFGKPIFTAHQFLAWADSR